MRFKPIFALCAALAFAGPAFADAIPMPMELTAEQDLLIGVWQEQDAPEGRAMGHGFQLRTIAFGNSDLTVLTFGGISYSKDYNTSAMRGTWTAKRVDDKTLKITLDQGEGRATELTLVFDGHDSFTLEDSERSYLGPSAFRRFVPPK
ncbi:hypothetical protein sos41_41520 [Alphaproteobacteria bacterium SO-S41]|nr:hypothetical protein sos41_41520 [Alphaproteobacteria bacterium SO-S41]